MQIKSILCCWTFLKEIKQFFMEIGTPADDPTAPPPPVTNADIQKKIALAPQYGLTILPPDSAID
jgi:hypothetical protein